ncbi:MAG: hypothetical protein JWO06_543 [Bacteroidota bacterium]|nr:hypothetical protein [Bacteroidota bacterium]
MKKIYSVFLLLAVAFSASAQISVISIDSARTNDANGVPVDSGLRIQVSGIVYGPNSYPTPNGDVFILYNHIAGVKVYSKHTFNYTVTDGDSVVVVGTLSQYGGEVELTPDKTVAADTIYKVGVGTIDPPKIVTVLTESCESELVEIQNIDMSTQSGWAIVAGKHYFDVHIGSYSLEIDSFVNPALFNMAAPTGIFNIVGIGTQYKYAAPYNSGYQLSPRSFADFHAVTGINSISNNEASAVVYPNPSNGSFIVQFGDKNMTNADVNIYDITGKIVYTAKQEVNNGQVTMNAQNLNTGIYIIEMRNGDQMFRNKITIQK